ncbi:DUF4362 domain-containing protein [Clostridiaceae bacterium M8S5]|nr:DUF4362 domain-containing protein [Clostridiaceae bacterium M8S5]
MFSGKTNKVLAIVCIIIIVGVFYIGYKRIEESNKIVAKVNNEPIYREDIERVIKLNSNTSSSNNITEKDIINAAIKEMIVIQEAKTIGIEISDDELEKSIMTLKNEHADLYEIVIKQYESEENYKQKLRNKYIFDAMKERVVQKYYKENPVNKSRIIREIPQYYDVDIKKLSKKEIESLTQQLMYLKNKSKINDYFDTWVDLLSKKYNIEYFYEDDNLTKLPELYTYEMAVANNDIIWTHDKTYNKELLDAFVKDINNKNTSKIRIVTFTKEGDAIIIHLKYNGKQIEATIDSTRDKFSKEPQIKTEIFDKIDIEEVFNDHYNKTFIKYYLVKGDASKILIFQQTKE